MKIVTLIGFLASFISISAFAAPSSVENRLTGMKVPPAVLTVARGLDKAVERFEQNQTDCGILSTLQTDLSIIAVAYVQDGQKKIHFAEVEVAVSKAKGACLMGPATLIDPATYKKYILDNLSIAGDAFVDLVKEMGF